MTTTPAVQLLEVRVSVPDAAAAQHLAKELVGRHLAACVQILGPMTSIYTWKADVHQAQEWLLLVKTTASAFDEVAAVVVELHRYEVPEILAVPITHTLESYGAWVVDNSTGATAREGEDPLG